MTVAKSFLSKVCTQMQRKALASGSARERGRLAHHTRLGGVDVRTPKSVNLIGANDPDLAVGIHRQLVGLADDYISKGSMASRRLIFLLVHHPPIPLIGVGIAGEVLFHSFSGEAIAGEVLFGRLGEGTTYGELFLKKERRCGRAIAPRPDVHCGHAVVFFPKAAFRSTFGWMY